MRVSRLASTLPFLLAAFVLLPAPDSCGATRPVPAASNCAVRKLTRDFAGALLSSHPMRGSLAQAVEDALELQAACSAAAPAQQDGPIDNLQTLLQTNPANKQPSSTALPAGAVFVDYLTGDDGNPGTESLPLKTVVAGVVKARNSVAKQVVLRNGTHFLDSGTIQLSAADSGLSLSAYPGEQPWLSGGFPIRGLSWSPVTRKGTAAHTYVANLTNTPAAVLEDIHSFRLHGQRCTAARFPNANPERDQFPVGYLDRSKHFLPPIQYTAAQNVLLPNVSRGGVWNVYKGGIGGPCSIFDPPFSMWCYQTSHGFTPAGVVMPNGTEPGHDPAVWQDPVADGGEVFAWRAAHWNNWMFQISGYVASNRTIRFGRGGFQGTRPGSGAEIFVRHIREELDAPNEFFLDRKAKQLYYVVNVTESPGLPSADGFVATFHRKIMDMHGNMTSPVRNISVNGIGFRDARATYLDPHGVPSGGDWALQRSAALTIEGSEGVTVMNCVFERNDGNGIMINGYNRDTLVLHNELRWTGDNAIGAWGRTDEVSDGGIHGADGTRGEHPDNTMVVGNAVHEVGMYEKQSSMYFQAKSCRSNITGNVFFNGPRAGINFNDGYCGGHNVTNNLVFNTCRESGDHGPFNSWDREPYFMEDGALPVPAVTTIQHNLVYGDYNGIKALDHDDGSSFYDDHHNVVYMGWGQKDFLPSPGHKHTHNTLIMYATQTVLTDHGGEDGMNAQMFYNNTVVSLTGDYGSINCSQPGLMVMANNTIFVPGDGKDFQLHCYDAPRGSQALTFEQLQAKGFEKGSQLHTQLPSDEEIVERAKILLLMATQPTQTAM